MNKNKVLLLTVPVFLMLFTTFQNFEETPKSRGKIDFSSLVDETTDEMAEVKQTAQERRAYYRQLRKNEILENKRNPKYFVDDGQQSAALEERVKVISKKMQAKKRRGPASIPDPVVSVEREIIQADK